MNEAALTKYLLHYEILRLQKHNHAYYIKAIIVFLILSGIFFYYGLNLGFVICQYNLWFYWIKLMYHIYINVENGSLIYIYSEAINEILKGNSTKPLPDISYDSIRDEHLIIAMNRIFIDERLKNLDEYDKYKIILEELSLATDNSY